MNIKSKRKKIIKVREKNNQIRIEIVGVLITSVTLKQPEQCESSFIFIAKKLPM
jgi:hypothetical protein